jgi:tetratricopeptide (TPR) repeat protein
MQSLISVLHEQGKEEESRPYTIELIALRKQAAQRADAGASKLNEYARVLLTCKPEDLRDPVSALSFAKRAVEKNEGESPLYLDTLSLAYFMTGDTAKAIETQVKALALLPNEDSSVRTEMETNMAKFRAADAEAQKMSIEKNQD